MIVSRNIGQLGNNLFQIAAAIGYARKCGYEWAADYSIGANPPFSKIHECFPNLPKHDLIGTRYHEHPNEFCQLHGMHKNECHFDYHEIPNLGPNVTLSGFYQSWKYFANAEEEVKQAFKLNYVSGYEDYVSIHVRRGDYVQHSGSFPPVNDDYLLKAMGHFIGKKFLFLSDDIQWCKDFVHKWFSAFDDIEIEFSEGRSTLEDFTLMASCGHHIIANSTFSYWAAYLGHNPNKIVISPSCKRGNWFGMEAGVKKDVVDLLPESWIQISFR